VDSVVQAAEKLNAESRLVLDKASEQRKAITEASGAVVEVVAKCVREEGELVLAHAKADAEIMLSKAKADVDIILARAKADAEGVIAEAARVAVAPAAPVVTVAALPPAAAPQAEEGWITKMRLKMATVIKP
jgi:F-type H+-transporting ATPase subunit b